MSEFLGRLRYFVADALDEWRHSPGINLLATATLAAVLFVAGLTLLLLANVESRLQRWREDVRLEVFLEDDISPTALEAVRHQLEALPGIARVVYVDRDAALLRFRESFGELAAAPLALGTNPLPASFEAFLKPGQRSTESARSISAAVRAKKGIEEIRYDQDWLDRLDAILDLARGIGACVSVLVFAAVVFVTASVLKLAVYARRDEVEIMLLVGATPAFIRGPFLVAGLAQGVAAALVALGLVEVSRRGTLLYAGSRSGGLLDLVLGTSMPAGFTGAILIVGLIVGFLSALFAVRRIV